MFDKTSRYSSLQVLTITVAEADGSARDVGYVERRFIPSAEGTTTLVQHVYQQGERLDNITARYTGDPAQFWRVCDANTVLSPDELTERLGQIIRIALPNS
ncbi:MAG TPA: LysM domain-containing protein [Blastocatellia bacterium]|nr:LysM domain-containing protein [Blastocatellia bacterium]